MHVGIEVCLLCCNNKVHCKGLALHAVAGVKL